MVCGYTEEHNNERNFNMPCNAEHMAASKYEIELSRVYCFLDELNGGTWRQDWYRGYHPMVYNRVSSHQARSELNKYTAQLCDKLKRVEDVTKYSLELQLWWRDHQADDRAREEREAKEKEDAQLYAEAMSKLTDKEKRVLGLIK